MIANILGKAGMRVWVNILRISRYLYSHSEKHFRFCFHLPVDLQLNDDFVFHHDLTFL
jgi:hypothetical protein